jgi:DUF1680 family protein
VKTVATKTTRIACFALVAGIAMSAQSVIAADATSSFAESQKTETKSADAAGSNTATIKIPDALKPAAKGTVVLSGPLGAKTNALIENSVMSQDLDRILQPFRDKKEVGDGDWRTEYWGKWATSAALACGYQPTPEHLAVMQKAVQELLATQEADGYIGTRKPEHHLKGWDVWGRKYVLLGLIGDYDATGDKAALEAARRVLDSLMTEVGPDKVNIAAIGYPQWKGLPTSSVLEPVVLLYERTGDKKYLEFAEHIVSQWSKPNHWSPNGLRLVEDAIAGKPVSQMGNAPTKAYEMMSCYEGLCELYRVTGNKKYLEAPVKLAESILKDEITIIGTGSAGELWCGGRNKQCDGSVVGMETCVTVTWMKFCVQLLRLTGDPKYADALETSLDNALLSALAPEGQWWAYFTLLLGERVPSHEQHADIGTSCCVLNGPRALLLTPSWAVMTDANGPVVNLYTSSTAEVCLASGNHVRLTQETTYPIDDKVMLKIQTQKSESFTLSLRIPAWSDQTSLSINGEKAAVELKPGSYAKIQRTWKDGDTVELKLDLRCRVVNEPTGKSFVALTRGPTVLTLERRLNPEATAATALELVRNGEFVALTPNPEVVKKFGVAMAFDVPFVAKDGTKQTLTLCDFASAGTTWNEKSLYRVWLPQPLDMATVWNGMPEWWKDILPGGVRPKMPQPPKSH